MTAKDLKHMLLESLNEMFNDDEDEADDSNPRAKEFRNKPILRTEKMTKSEIASFKQLFDAVEAAHNMLHEAKAQAKKAKDIMTAVQSKKSRLWDELMAKYNMHEAFYNSDEGVLEIYKDKAKAETTGASKADQIIEELSK